MIGLTIRILNKTETLLMVFFLSLLCLLIFIEIIMRTFFQTGLPWLEEFGRYVLVLSTFLGASIAIKRDDHPRMSAFLQALPAKPRRVAMVVAEFVLGCFLLVLSYYAGIQVLNLIRIGTRASTLPFPLWLTYAVLPVSIFVMGIRCFISARNNVRALRGNSPEKKENDS